MRSLRVFQGFRDFDRKGGRTVDILRFDGGDTDLLQYIIHIYILRLMGMVSLLLL